MPYGKLIDIEIIAHGSEVKQIQTIAAHVKKYTENFIYTDKIADVSTPIAYYESEPLDSWKNIQLVDQTHIIPSNSIGVIGDNLTWMKVASTSFVSPYKDMAITNRSVVDEWGKEKPLFFKHILPKGTVQTYVQVIEDGNKHDIETGMIIDIPSGVIWINYQNYFDPDTGAYKLYFVSSVSEDPDDPGRTITSQALLNPVPAIGAATWEDLDLDTGEVTATSYVREETSNGWQYTIYSMEPSSIEGVDFKSLAAQQCEDDAASNHDYTDGLTGYFFAKPLSEGMLKCKMPAGRSPTDPWTIRITNGQFFELLLGKMRKYWVPEYNYQPFSPSKPYIYSPHRELIWINKRNLVATRRHLAISPKDARHIDIQIFNRDDELVAIWTSNPAKETTRYSDTDIYYENNILSWDNRRGIIGVSVDADAGYRYVASFFYEAKDLEYTALTLNPLQYPDALVNMWIYYCVPDAHKYDRAIQVVGVDAQGKIVYCSQSEGRSMENLQLLDSNGDYNPDTVIGMKYSSMISDENFKNKYCVPYVNDYQYYILGEVLVMDIGDEEDSVIFDTRRSGISIKDGYRIVGNTTEDNISYFEDAIRANPKILQSSLGYGPDGQIVPNNNVMVVKAPITLLEGYGGVLSAAVAEKLLSKYLPAANVDIVDWEYTKPVLNGKSMTPGVCELTFSWEGPNITYNLYRTTNPVGEWTKIAELETGDDRLPLLTYVDSDEELTKGVVHYYRIRVIENEIEYPPGYMLGIMVRPDTGEAAAFLTVEGGLETTEV